MWSEMKLIHFALHATAKNYQYCSFTNKPWISCAVHSGKWQRLGNNWLSPACLTHDLYHGSFQIHRSTFALKSKTKCFSNVQYPRECYIHANAVCILTIDCQCLWWLCKWIFYSLWILVNKIMQLFVGWCYWSIIFWCKWLTIKFPLKMSEHIFVCQLTLLNIDTYSNILIESLINTNEMYSRVNEKLIYILFI